jgi:uncharacterized protein (TIGR02300 family)
MRRRGLGLRDAVGLGKDLRGNQIIAIATDVKALRGTKRVCHACAARFYDLSRDPIVCPECGAHVVPDAMPTAAAVGAGTARFTHKTGWRSRNFKHADPDVAPEVKSSEDGNEEAAVSVPHDDVVLEEEQDEADVAGWVDHHQSDER